MGACTLPYRFRGYSMLTHPPGKTTRQQLEGAQADSPTNIAETISRLTNPVGERRLICNLLHITGSVSGARPFSSPPDMTLGLDTQGLRQHYSATPVRDLDPPTLGRLP